MAAVRKCAEGPAVSPGGENRGRYCLLCGLCSVVDYSIEAVDGSEDFQFFLMQAPDKTLGAVIG